MFISILYSRNHIKFLKIKVKDMKKFSNFHTFTQETYKFSKHNSKIREKAYKFPCNYSRNLKMLNKIHEKSFKKCKIFHNMTEKTKNPSIEKITGKKKIGRKKMPKTSIS